VSRIDEALSRTQGIEQGLSPAAPSQSAFRPAWPLVEDVPETFRGRDGELRSVAGSPVGFSSAWSQRLVNSPLSDAGLLEQFRRLAGTLHKARRMNGLRSVMVTSATPGDGKTLTAINLALMLSSSFNSEVLLVDADLRRPSIPSIVDFRQEAGLSEALTARSEQKLALVRIAPRLTLLPAGQPIANSIEAVTSPRMQQILSEAASRYDWIILDAPPVGITTDARLLAEFVGGTLLVIRAGQTQHADIAKAIAALGREQILGVVLNGTTGSKEDGTYYGEPYPGKNR
jgi:capsular exopolysaccharide synthesis family protein